MKCWPEFEASARAYPEFFEVTSVRAFSTPLRSIAELNLKLTSVEGQVLNARREHMNASLTFLHSLAVQLSLATTRRPSTTQDALQLVRRFETLLFAPSILQIEELYRALGPSSSRPNEFTECMARFVAFKAGYEAFARRANQELGRDVFRTRFP